jgi:hypothetical protein
MKITLGEKKLSKVTTAVFLLGSLIALLYGIYIYPFQGTQVTIPSPAPFKSIIPLTQSGTTQFIIPLPPAGQSWEMPVTVVCTLSNLTNAGVYQDAPVELTVSLTLQNFAATGAEADDYIYIGWFNVVPVDAIEASQLTNPAEFSSLLCRPDHTSAAVNMSNPAYDTFSASDQVILQDTGLLNLQIKPIMFEKNPVDPVWTNFNYTNFQPTVAIPISIMSELDASRELMDEQQQNLQYNFTVLQLRLTANQETETTRGNSLTFFLLAFALFDIAVAVISLSLTRNKDEEEENRQRRETERQTKIFEYLSDEHVIV